MCGGVCGCVPGSGLNSHAAPSPPRHVDRLQRKRQRAQQRPPQAPPPALAWLATAVPGPLALPLNLGRPGTAHGTVVGGAIAQGPPQLRLINSFSGSSVQGELQRTGHQHQPGHPLMQQQPAQVALVRQMSGSSTEPGVIRQMPPPRSVRRARVTHGTVHVTSPGGTMVSAPAARQPPGLARARAKSAGEMRVGAGRVGEADEALMTERGMGRLALASCTGYTGNAAAHSGPAYSRAHEYAMAHEELRRWFQ
jgi:hypothetical protein